MENRNFKLQNLILSIAEDVKYICEKYEIDYFMVGGTHLGAIRHKGFIPWDDDFDIAMKRDNYNKFLELCHNELDSDKYFIQNEETEINYAFSFTKIQLRNTEIIEDFSKDVDINHGIFIDIFPYDNVPDNFFCRKIHLVFNHFYKNAIWIKCGYGTFEHKKKINYKVIKSLSFFSDVEKLKIKRYKLITKFNDKDTDKAFNSDYPNELLFNSWFKNKKLFKFESTYFQGFEKYNEYLINCFGDYMKIPPIEKRKVHSIYEINYGPYEKNE